MSNLKGYKILANKKFADSLIELAISKSGEYKIFKNKELLKTFINLDKAIKSFTRHKK